MTARAVVLYRLSSDGRQVYVEDATSETEEHLLVVDICDTATIVDYKEELRHVPFSPPWRDVIFRCDSARIESELAHSGILDVFQQQGGKLSLYSGSALTAASNALSPDFRDAWRADVLSALEWGQAVWDVPGYHFALAKSSTHAPRFVRFSDALESPATVTRLAHAVLAHTVGPTILTVDTGALLSVAYRAQQMASATARPIVSVFQVAGVDRSGETLADSMSRIGTQAMKEGTRILSLVSVSSSGRYVRRLEQAAHDLKLGDWWTHLAFLCTDPASRLNALASVGIPVEPSHGCSMCASGSEVLNIDPRRLDVSLTPVPLSLPGSFRAVDTSSRIAAAEALDAFRVHYTPPGSLDHFSYYVDVAALLNDAAFRSKFVERAQALPNGVVPQLVLVPDSAFAHAIQELAHEVFPHARVAVVQTNTTEASRDSTLVEAIATSKHIVVLEACVRTGRTLLAVNALVQRVRQSIGTQNELWAIALLDRHPSPRQSKTRNSRLFVHHKQHYRREWELPLPGYSANDVDSCPWCRELRMWERLRTDAAGSVLSCVDARIDLLSRTEEPLREPFFGVSALLIEDDHRPTTETTPDSYFGNLRTEGALISSATFLCEARDGWHSDPSHRAVPRYLPLDVLLGRYDDAVLVASMLRAIVPGEVWGGRVEDDVRAVFRSRTHAFLAPVVAAEIAIAAYENRVPRSMLTDEVTNHLAGLAEEARGSIELVLERLE